MIKRFLHVCKNPVCNQEFAIVRSIFLHDKSGKVDIGIMVRCPHCKKLQKITLPRKKG